MKRPHFHPASCKNCGRQAKSRLDISQTGLCSECSKARFLANLDAMKTMSGPYAKTWRQRMAASVGAVLLDDALERP